MKVLALLLFSALGLAAQDKPCTLKATFTLSATSGNVQIVAAPTLAGQAITVCAVYFSTAAEHTIKYVSGTGTNCGTNSADETGALPGIQYWSYEPPQPVRLVLGLGRAFCINWATAATGGGWAAYRLN